RVPAQQNIGTPAGHVGRDRDLALPAGLRDDFGFFLVIFGIQYDVFDARPLQHRAEFFRTIDGDRADQCRLPFFVALFDLLDDSFEFFALGTIYVVGILYTFEQTFRWINHHVKTIDYLY